MQRNTFTNRQADPTQGRPGGFSFFRKLGALALVLVGIGASQQAWGQSGVINNSAISLSYKPTANATPTSKTYAGSANSTTYNRYSKLAQSTNSGTTPPMLGTYDLNGNSNVTITGAMLRGIVADSGTNVDATRLQYRVYLQGTTQALIPNYSNLALTTSQTSNDVGGGFSGANNTANINLLTGLTSGGTYIIDVRFQGDLSNASGNTGSAVDPQGGGYYYATFFVTPPTTTPAGGTTTWQGTATGTSPGGSPTPTDNDTNWNLPSNWSNGVPTALSDAIIPASTTGTNIVYPILTSGNLTSTRPTYRVRNLTLQGGQSSTGGQVTINATVLRVYGDLRQVAGGMSGNATNSTGRTDSTANSTLVFAGKDQIITGNLLISDIIIAGSGTKSVINQLSPSNILAFRPASVSNGAIIQSAVQDVTNGAITTTFSTAGTSYIQLAANGRISRAIGEAETISSYIKGVTRSERTIKTDSLNTFGNIGLDATFNHNPGGTIVVYRVVGDALNSPPNSTAKPINRQYQIIGDDNSNNNAFAGSTLSVVFHYLDSNGTTSANELNGIKEQNLTMFRTLTKGAPYSALGGTLDTLNNTVTRLAINSLTDFKLTLGDRTNPLPVTLAAFAATRSGNKALITWTTATEENNQGFNVQVSTDGTSFRNLGFVESKSVNSVQAQNYSYTDVEAGKAGTRYYRLEQVDIDGTKSYSQVRAVSFSGSAATSLSLAASPNPFNSELTLTFDGLSTPDGTAHVRLVDMTGRLVRDQDVPLTGASIALGDLSGLRSGLYLAKVTLADGTTKTVRVQRQ